MYMCIYIVKYAFLVFLELLNYKIGSLKMHLLN